MNIDHRLIEWYLVYLPAMEVISRSFNKNDIVIEYQAIGQEYDEDYSIMADANYWERCDKLGIMK